MHATLLAPAMVLDSLHCNTPAFTGTYSEQAMLIVLLWSWLKVAFKSESIKAKQSQLKENFEECDRSREGGLKTAEKVSTGTKQS